MKKVDLRTLLTAIVLPFLAALSLSEHSQAQSSLEATQESGDRKSTHHLSLQQLPASEREEENAMNINELVQDCSILGNGV